MANLRDYRGFLRAGYSTTELALNFFRLMIWSRLTSALKHSFAHRGAGVVIDCTVNVQGSGHISIGEGSWVQRYTHLSVPLIEMKERPSGSPLKIGKRVQIGGRCFFAAINSVDIEDEALFGPNVYMADHTHAYGNPEVSIRDQGIGAPGSIRVGKGSWIGINAVIIAIEGKEIVIGEGAIVSANSVVTRSVPPRTMVAGVPARVIKIFDEKTRKWAPSADGQTPG